VGDSSSVEFDALLEVILSTEDLKYNYDMIYLSACMFEYKEKDING